MELLAACRDTAANRAHRSLMLETGASPERCTAMRVTPSCVYLPMFGLCSVCTFCAALRGWLLLGLKLWSRKHGRQKVCLKRPVSASGILNAVSDFGDCHLTADDDRKCYLLCMSVFWKRSPSNFQVLHQKFTHGINAVFTYLQAGKQADAICLGTSGSMTFFWFAFEGKHTVTECDRNKLK